MNDKVVNPRRIPIYTPENLAGDYEMKYETALALFRKHLRLGNREDAQVARAIARAWKPDPTNAWERDLGVPHEIALRCEKWMHEEFATLPPSDLWNIFTKVKKTTPLGAPECNYPRLLHKSSHPDVAVCTFLCAFDRREATQEIVKRIAHPCHYAARQFELYCETLEA